MNPIDWIRHEPAVFAALVGIAATLAITLGANQGTVGAILSAIQAVLAVLVRQNVTPTAA